MATFKHLPTLVQLRHLIALNEQRHFGQAADLCFITQSSLSTSIKELEKILGQPLVERTKRKVMMLPLGLEVVNRARYVLREVEDITDVANAASCPLSTPIRLGVIPSIAPFLLPRVLPAVKKYFPNLKLYLREDQSGALIQYLKNGELDLLLLAFPYSIEGLESNIFSEDPFWIAFPKGHAYSQEERVAFKELNQQNLMLLSDGHCLREQIIDAFGRENLHIKDDFQASSLHTLVEMVNNGLGLTVLPKMALDTGIIKSTQIQVRPLDGPHTSREIGLAWRKTSARKTEYQQLANFFRDGLAIPLSLKGQSIS
jgi:LysR family hydrogen peroxide-inducible transcriptional activator